MGTSWSLGTSFTNFTLPTKEEGFDDVKYEWDKKTKCAGYVKDWILHRKLTTRVEDIQPSEWFTQQHGAWQQQLQKWHLKQAEWKVLAKSRADATRQKKEMLRKRKSLRRRRVTMLKRRTKTWRRK